MAYSVPKMPLLFNAWGYLTPLADPPRLSGRPCQLRGPAFPGAITTGGNLQQPFHWILVVPKREDLRDGWNGFSPDFIECPAGTGRFYRVLFVDDIARGFTNEYRIAILTKHGAWPTPIP